MFGTYSEYGDKVNMGNFSITKYLYLVRYNFVFIAAIDHTSQ